jgi:hypothetical protein
MIKKFTDESLDALSKNLIKWQIPAYPDGRHRITLDTLKQLPDGAVIEPAENPLPDTDLEHLGTYKQFHIFIGR